MLSNRTAILAAGFLAFTAMGLCAAETTEKHGPALPEMLASAPKPRRLVLRPDAVKACVDAFSASDEELYPSYIGNTDAWPFLERSVPWFECPDKELEEIYYFRWWTYRKHIKSTPDGFVVTEFLPKVSWSGKHNTISCPAGHHLYEGRWLSDPRYLDDYSVFWFRKGGDPRRYSFWVADAIWARALVAGDTRLAIDLLPDLVANFEAWEQTHRDPNGLFWQIDDRDGMEVSIGGSGYRATINSYMYGDAMAIAQIAELAGKPQLAATYRGKARQIRQLVQEKLWDPQAECFKVAARGESIRLADVRELHGYTPWYFHLPDPEKVGAWKQLMDPQGFFAPYGPATAERRHPRFTISYEGHECQWNGPSWPFATSVTLVAMANVLNEGQQEVIGRRDYLNLLKVYAKSHRLKREDGRVVPWIDENLNPQTGDWIARTRLKTWRNGTWDPRKGGVERGKDYNHSSYCDLVISGLVGLRPRPDETLEVNPLVPDNTWDYFCLDGVRYHNHWLTILYDRTGKRYKQGTGLRVFADGQEVAFSEKLSRLTVSLGGVSPLPETAGGWVKYPGSPVLGGDLGTCFDISALKEGAVYGLWISWRPKASIALVESADGVHWSKPEIVLGPNPKTDWESQVSRPARFSSRATGT